MRQILNIITDKPLRIIRHLLIIDVELLKIKYTHFSTVNSVKNEDNNIKSTTIKDLSC